MIFILPIVRESYDKGCQTEEEEKYEDTDEDYIRSSRGERDSNTQTPRKVLSRSQSGFSSNSLNWNTNSTPKLDLPITSPGLCHKLDFCMIS